MRLSLFSISPNNVDCGNSRKGVSLPCCTAFLACVVSVLTFASVTRLRAADSASALDADASAFFSSHVLPEPLVPATGTLTRDDNERLKSCLANFAQRTRSDDFSALETFAEGSPSSPWRLAILTNLGLLQYRAGYFSRCIPSFLAAWEAGKAATEPRAKALADRAAGEYTKMLSRLGRYDALKAFLVEVKGREFIGQATELMIAGLEGSTTMETHPGISFRCGPMALGRILASQGSPLATSPILIDSESSTRGVSLSGVRALSEKLGMNYQVAKRAPGAVVVIPSVIHWKVGHYAALTKRFGERFLTEDPTFEHNIWHTADALEAEASGYFLIPPGPLPAGWTAVDDEEAKVIFGKGQNTGARNDVCINEPLVHILGSCPGMAAYSFRAMLASLQITDTPVGYTPPYGYPVQFAVTYVQRDSSQPSNFNFSNLGPKWGFNWQHYMMDDPANPAVAAQISTAGAVQLYNYDQTTGGYYVFKADFDSNDVLRRPTSGLPFEITHPDGSKEVYGLADGSTVSPRRIFLTQMIDPAGNTTVLAYDSQLRLTKITDALGQETTIAYAVSGDPYKISSVTDPFGRSASFSYDGLGRLTQIQDVIGIQSVFTYTGSTDFINSLTTPYGTTSFSNTETGTIRRLTATDPAGDTEVLESNNLITSAVPTSEPVAPTLPTTTVFYNLYHYYRNSFHWNKKQWKEGANDYSKAHIYHWLHDKNPAQMGPYLESEKDPLQGRVFYAYEGQTSFTTVGTRFQPKAVGRSVEGGDQVTEYQYNSLGRITATADPLGRITTYTYAANNQDLLSVAQLNGGMSETLSSFTYNAQHLPLTSTDAAAQTTTFTYNDVGQPLTITNAKNEITAFAYYAADATGKQRKGRLSSIDGPLAGTADTTTFDYSSTGNVASVTGPDGYTLAYTYDALDRVTRVTFPDATYNETTYQALDPKTSRDRLGRITTYVYNSIRQLASVTDPANRTIQYKWCKCGALQQLIDAMGRVTKWRHDVASRLTAKEYVDGSTVTYDYEPESGRLSAVTDEKGQIKSYDYNRDNTLAKLSYANVASPTPAVSYTYDLVYNRLASMTDGIGTTHYVYNPIQATPALGAGQLASVDGPWANDTITYDYDALGRVISRAIDGVAEATTYDAAGRPGTIVNPLGTFTYAYDGATARLASATHDGGVKSVYTYYPNAQDHRLQRIANLKPDGTTPLSVFDYTYDAQGRITTWKQQQDNAVASAQTWTLGYDESDQLTSNVVTQGASTVSTSAWTYDAAGNRKSETINGVTTTAGYNALNEQVNTTAALPATSYEWDGENRLVAINQGTNRSEFSYDGLGRRVKIMYTANGMESADSIYIWDGMAIRERRDSDGSTVQNRYYSHGFQAVSTGPKIAHFYAKDHLGSVRAVVSATGDMEERIVYDAWGNTTSSKTSGRSTFGFTGHFELSGFNLNLTLFRVYSPVQGRWLSRDPINASSGQSSHSYVRNNPLISTDPLGLTDINVIDPEDPAFEAIQNYNPTDRFTFAGHGFSDDSDNLTSVGSKGNRRGLRGRLISVEEIGNLILRKWDGIKPLYSVACHGSSSGFNANLAKYIADYTGLDTTIYGADGEIEASFTPAHYKYNGFQSVGGPGFGPYTPSSTALSPDPNTWIGQTVIPKGK